MFQSLQHILAAVLSVSVTPLVGRAGAATGPSPPIVDLDALSH